MTGFWEMMVVTPVMSRSKYVWAQDNHPYIHLYIGTMKVLI